MLLQRKCLHTPPDWQTREVSITIKPIQSPSCRSKNTRKQLSLFKKTKLKKSLVDIMKELYEKTNNKGVAMKPIMYKEGYLSKLGGYLKENEVIQTLIRYCLSDPECDKYQLG